jgi:outer membrane protein assembly factor BamB
MARRTVHLNGTVDSSPIELHAVRVRGRSRDVIFVTTTYGRTIAIDAPSGHRLWEYVPPGIGSYERTYQFTTATPIADSGRRYLFAASPDGAIRKLAVATGHEVRSAHWPVRITRLPAREKIPAALNISGHYVIATTGGYVGDAPPYQGHVAMIDRSTGRLLHLWNSLCSNVHRLMQPSSCPYSASAIWARSGAVVEPRTGRLLVATGNAPFNGSTAWGDSVLELTPDASGLLHNWTPTEQGQLNATDTDLGSTAPALLPEAGGRRLAVQGGKAGYLALLDLDRLNGTGGGPSARLGGELQRISSPGHDQVFTAPAVWSHGGTTYVFVADNSGTAAYVLSGARLHVAWGDGMPGTSPVVAGGLLYVYDPIGGRLVIRRPVGGGKVASLAAAPGHWNSPIVVGGRVVLPVGNANDQTTNGTLEIWHLRGR